MMIDITTSTVYPIIRGYHMTKKMYLIAAPGEKLSDHTALDFQDAIWMLAQDKTLGKELDLEYVGAPSAYDFAEFLADHAFEIARANGWTIIQERI